MACTDADALGVVCAERAFDSLRGVLDSLVHSSCEWGFHRVEQRQCDPLTHLCETAATCVALTAREMKVVEATVVMAVLSQFLAIALFFTYLRLLVGAPARGACQCCILAHVAAAGVFLAAGLLSCLYVDAFATVVALSMALVVVSLVMSGGRVAF
jgi:hypothetical protein